MDGSMEYIAVEIKYELLRVIKELEDMLSDEDILNKLDYMKYLLRGNNGT